MTHVRHRLAIAAALTAAAVLMTGCQSDSDSEGDSGGGGSAALSLDGLVETADGVPEDGADTCPLPYDIAAAAKAAGVDGEAGPGPVREDAETPVATGEGGKRAKGKEPLAENPGALVSCTFHIGPDDVRVHTVATEERNAITILAPVVSELTRVAIDDVVAFTNEAATTEETGKVVTADTGNVATVRLELDGEGDAALLVGTVDGESGEPDAALDRKQLAALTEALAGQVQQ
ncbi:hypothetical protein [Streptomyces sp. NPDC006997]|uniref:hypothetical protein n=1 Tax=Streptomyces sp. NPDC006997 TaxID=3155356 RepID=UPI0033FCC501